MTELPHSAGILPAGLTTADFARALADFAAAIGEEHTHTDAETLAEYGDPYRPAGTGTRASAVLLPGSVAEVQAVVRLANRYRIPLWTVSQGRNFGYGGGSPRVPGSVIVSLRRMDRVLEVNEDLAYAVVEPGVSFEKLYETLRAGNHRLTVSVPDIGWGSIIGNTLDHGYGFTWYGDHAERACGMEVVLPDGDLLRTGMGALTGGHAWHVHRRGFGPAAESLFMQSNFGIVTRMGVWLMPTPECYAPCFLKVPADSDLERLVGIVRGLLLDRTIQNIPLLADGLMLASAVARRDRWWPGPGPVPDDVITRILDELGLGRWNVRFALYGSEHIVDAQLSTIREAVSGIPGAELIAAEHSGDAAPADIPVPDHVQAGIPNREMLGALNWRGGRAGNLNFSPVAPLSGTHIRRLIDLLRPVMHDAGFDCLSAVMLTPRSGIAIFGLVYDSDDHDQVERAFAACREMVETAGRHGYGEYRSHLDVMDHVSGRFDFNDHAQRRFNQKIKDALDPHGILSPGKQGIWPGRTP
ncbi:FAD-binding oxidoreductase [Amycolatopsis acidicola]|uniref:FAD-binding oxidoreductase n=1 Tax=Amycolatopsis acidicola TaxID=2596893 RepID=A0A5N0V507_9PSEU|nr:FAD-binding oxidoreductase [Amycolatopsis acidicola]KAA9160884.1 FAD-binding oxidoreductase [Amycolatopsis acidicola]